MRKTKIVVTIGPATQSYDKVEALIKRGVNIFRLNFSHGDYETHKRSIDLIRKASKKLGRVVGILQDISGPKIRIGEIDGVLKLKRDDELILSKSKKNGSLDISYPEIIDAVEIGDEVYFADGVIKSVVIDKDSDFLKLRLLNSGELSSFKGVNFPKSDINISAITPKDEKDLEFGAKEGIDFVAFSFVQNKYDLKRARSVLKSLNYDPFVIAKIETTKAVENLKEILTLSDGVMVARGDLGAEFGVTKVPRIQKEIIKLANRMNKPVITATQMLTSMKENPFPTRAEVSDIANAVLDGTDAVMLSDETAVGKYPLLAVKVLHDSCKEAEKAYEFYKDFPPLTSSDAIAKSAVELAKNLDMEALVPFTTTGYSAMTLSRYRPKENIYAVAHSNKTLRRISLFWGVRPLMVMEELPNPSRMLNQFIKNQLEKGFINKDSRFVVTMGSSTGRKGSTNLIRVIDKEGIESILNYK